MVQHKVMVTAGANQAFVNLVLALLDPQDAVVLFAPYYFNHMMALQVIPLPYKPYQIVPLLVWLIRLESQCSLPGLYI